MRPSCDAPQCLVVVDGLHTDEPAEGRRLEADDQCLGRVWEGRARVPVSQSLVHVRGAVRSGGVTDRRHDRRDEERSDARGATRSVLSRSVVTPGGRTPAVRRRPGQRSAAAARSTSGDGRPDRACSCCCHWVIGMFAPSHSWLRTWRVSGGSRRYCVGFWKAAPSSWWDNTAWATSNSVLPEPKAWARSSTNASSTSTPRRAARMPVATLTSS